MNRSPLSAFVSLLVVAAVIASCGVLTGPDQAAPSLGRQATGPSIPPIDVGATVGVPTASATSAPIPATANPTATATPAANLVAPVAVPIVPVTQFRSTRTTTGIREVGDILAGRSARYEALELVASEADAVLTALGLARPTDPDRLILVVSAPALTADLAMHRKRLAFLRAADVTPAVRALAWGSRSLFGVDRSTDPGGWPLTAPLSSASSGGTFDPGATWTLFAGGDILLDRGVYETVRIKDKGVDFPFDGGTAEITGHCKDCSAFGWDLPYSKRTGNTGVVRDLVSGADLAIANFENPAPTKFRWHTKGTVFSADPGIIDGLANAGIDYVGLANNHIGDAGGAGILQTIRNVERRGLAHSGAGADASAARRPAMLEVNGTTVAILAYDQIARYYFADADTPGSSGLSPNRVAADVKGARRAGADIVIVFPHWGTEYKQNPFSAQRSLAHQIIDAGADMIIGNHAHWAAAMEVYEGKPIWYALGNFVFDQTWSEPTMEGITLELTFQGGTLAQVRMRPHIILDKAQPNFMDPAGDGRVVMNQVFGGPAGMLPW
ncbi:MAG: CapA family protein [Candidatus Limnocylindrales bacterium]